MRGNFPLHYVLKDCSTIQRQLGLLTDRSTPNEELMDFSNLTLFLITKNAQVEYLLEESTKILNDSNFNKDLPVTVVCHGFLTTQHSAFPVDMSKALVEKGGTNVLTLDSSSIIYRFYVRAVLCVKEIGQILGQQLALLSQGGVKPKDIHLIGHSLGAHISGYAGHQFMITTGSQLGRISGLDPAGPCFYDQPISVILNSEDADFVDIIHTDTGTFGIIIPSGHVDFYPNGGSVQPGSDIVSGNHGRSWQLYIESIHNTTAFLAVQCPDWNTFQKGKCKHNPQAYMGYGLSSDASGTFYLRTGKYSPYGLGVNGIKKTTVPMLSGIYSRIVGFFKI